MTKHFRYVVALGVALLGISTVPIAQAAPGTADEDWAIAEAYWGRQPTQCSVIVKGDTPLPENAGEASQPFPGFYGPCIFEIRPGQDLEAQCIVIVHEYGHLLGEGHSADPDFVMHSPPVRGSVPGCDLPSTIGEPPSTMVKPFTSSHRRHRRFARGSSIYAR
jgi:hypothetical protein